MAQFLNQEKPTPDAEFGENDGMNAMGKPIPIFRRDNAFHHCKAMGLSTQDSWNAIGAVANKLERDEPFLAMQEGMKWLDLTGTYRLFAALLTGKESPPEYAVAEFSDPVC